MLENSKMYVRISLAIRAERFYWIAENDPATGWLKRQQGMVFCLLSKKRLGGRK